ncbi:hypothetical protein [Naasia sp. SYSU D00057]|uniref:hypothetical protein n=1 Tax=Naasia sp. SYSU D00057 TaxID=2817380 RepID=UPI001B314815|nr:hypothetical protein [Naasia sp. SYSU D00057]
MAPDPLTPESSRAAAAAAAELRPLAVAVAALADVEWHSPAGTAYRRVVENLAGRTAGVAALLDQAAVP